MSMMLKLLPAIVVTVVLAGGCATPPPLPFDDSHTQPPSMLTLVAGEELEITFFGAPDLDTVQQIRRDGYITLKLIGDVQASGKTPAELEQALLALYEDQLQVKAITVVVRNPGNVLVSGAVLMPGRVLMTHQLTVLEAIMSAGGVDYGKADLQRVMVVRPEGGEQKSYLVDLEPALEGKPSRPFYLLPLDTVVVPWSEKAKKFYWYQQQQ